MIKTIHENYPAFYNMLIATTLLGNKSSSDYDRDAGKIIEFIGKAFFFDEEIIKYCQKMILDELVTISVKEDVNAFINSHNYDTEPEENDSLLMMKCDAINVVESLGEVKNVHLNPDWFNYTHYKSYYPLVRYRQLALAASTGNPIANKATALMLYLGIGVQKTKENRESAIYKLQQCLMWGDSSAAYYLRYIFASEGKEQEAAIYADLMKLIPYLEEGRTVLPEEKQKEISEEALKLFNIISSIKQDIVINEQRVYIDYSFVEVILMEKIDYYRKLKFINEYRQQEWKEASNSSVKKIGIK